MVYIGIFSMISVFYESRYISERMVQMGYNKREIEESLSQNKYDDMTATYLLLSRRTTEV